MLALVKRCLQTCSHLHILQTDEVLFVGHILHEDHIPIHMGMYEVYMCEVTVKYKNTSKQGTNVICVPICLHT